MEIGLLLKGKRAEKHLIEEIVFCTEYGTINKEIL
jgi:hypothetical protein